MPGSASCCRPTVCSPCSRHHRSMRSRRSSRSARRSRTSASTPSSFTPTCRVSRMGMDHRHPARETRFRTHSPTLTPAPTPTAGSTASRCWPRLALPTAYYADLDDGADQTASEPRRLWLSPGSTAGIPGRLLRRPLRYSTEIARVQAISALVSRSSMKPSDCMSNRRRYCPRGRAISSS